jgi:hypothetical protein
MSFLSNAAAFAGGVVDGTKKGLSDSRAQAHEMNKMQFAAQSRQAEISMKDFVGRRAKDREDARQYQLLTNALGNVVSPDVVNAIRLLGDGTYKGTMDLYNSAVSKASRGDTTDYDRLMNSTKGISYAESNPAATYIPPPKTAGEAKGAFARNLFGDEGLTRDQDAIIESTYSPQNLAPMAPISTGSTGPTRQDVDSEIQSAQLLNSTLDLLKTSGVSPKEIASFKEKYSAASDADQPTIANNFYNQYKSAVAPRNKANQIVATDIQKNSGLYFSGEALVEINRIIEKAGATPFTPDQSKEIEKLGTTPIKLTPKAIEETLERISEAPRELQTMLNEQFYRIQLPGTNPTELADFSKLLNDTPKTISFDKAIKLAKDFGATGEDEIVNIASIIKNNGGMTEEAFNSISNPTNRYTPSIDKAAKIAQNSLAAQTGADMSPLTMSPVFKPGSDQIYSSMLNDRVETIGQKAFKMQYRVDNNLVSDTSVANKAMKEHESMVVELNNVAERFTEINSDPEKKDASENLKEAFGTINKDELFAKGVSRRDMEKTLMFLFSRATSGANEAVSKTSIGQVNKLLNELYPQ